MSAALEIAMTSAAIRNQAKPPTVLMLLATAARAAAAHAEKPSHALVLTAHLNAAGATVLTAGKYAAALS
jgi:hypothetical protein